MEIIKEASFLKGTFYEIKNGEMLAPPVDSIIVSGELPNSNLACLHKGCSNKVIVSEHGNRDYAWYFLTNKSDSYVGITIKRQWMYENVLRSDTIRHRLYPGQHKEVFSFPRNQRPECCIISCNFE